MIDHHTRPQGRDSTFKPSPLAPERDVTDMAIVLEEYLHLRGIGQRPSRTEFLARHPAIAGELADCLDGLDLVLSAQDDLSPTGSGDSAVDPLTPFTRLGDYQIIREVGR